MIEEMLIDTMTRYAHTHGCPPDRMRASRFLGSRLMCEMQDRGMLIVSDPAYCNAHPLPANCFSYRGCVVLCDLPAEPLRVVA